MKINKLLQPTQDFKNQSNFSKNESKLVKINKVTSQNIVKSPLLKNKSHSKISNLNEIFNPPASYFDKIPKSTGQLSRTIPPQDYLSNLFKSKYYNYNKLEESNSLDFKLYNISDRPITAFIANINELAIKYTDDNNQAPQLISHYDFYHKLSSNAPTLYNIVDDIYKENIKNEISKLLIKSSEYKAISLPGKDNNEISLRKLSSSNSLCAENGFKGLINISSLLNMDVENIIKKYSSFENNKELQAMPIKELVKYLSLKAPNNGSLLLLMNKLEDITESVFHVLSKQTFNLINLKSEKDCSNIEIKSSRIRLVTLYKNGTNFVVKTIKDPVSIHIEAH